MKFLSGVLSKKELQELVAVPEACVRVERQVRHIALLPHCLRDLKSAIIGTLQSYLNKFDVGCSGFVMGFKNVKLLTDRATIINDEPFLHFDIEADFYIFTPNVGCTLIGTVNKKGVNHIGCLVHKCFHVSIPRPDEKTSDEWLGTLVNIGDQVTFCVEVCDFTGSLPYIRGRLIHLSSQHVTSMKEDEMDGMSEQKKKKHKGEQLSESAEIDLMASSVEQEELQPALGTKYKKRKRHIEDEREPGAERKKKKQEVKDYKSVNYQAQDSHFTGLSSEDASTSQQSSVMNKVETDSCVIDEYCKVKKKKKHDLHNAKLSHMQNKLQPVLGTQYKERKRHIEDEGETGAERKKKKKQAVKDYKSVNYQAQDSYFTGLSSEDASTSQKSSVMNKVETDSCVIDEYCKAKKKKRKKHDLHNVKLSHMQNGNDKPTAKEESLVRLHIPVKDKSLGSVTGNVQDIAVPSVADLLNSVKSKLKLKLRRKHKKDDHDETKSDSHLLAVSHGKNERKKCDKSHHNKKQHNSEKSNSSVSFDPTAKLVEYMSKYEATGKKDYAANECHSLKEDAADTRTSNTSFRSSFGLTGAGMANAADRRRKKMNKGKGDAIPVRRSLLLLPSSLPCSEADRPVGQAIVRTHSIESLTESYKSPDNECGVLQTPEKCFTHNEVSRSPSIGSSNKVDIPLARPKGLGSNLSFLSPKQVTSAENTPFRSILSRKGSSDSHLHTVASAASSRNNSKEVSDVNSPKTKDKTPVSSGYTHDLNVGKVPTHDKSHGMFIGRELINAGVTLSQHSDVLQRLQSLSVDARSAAMCELSPLQAKSVNEVSTDLVKETVTTEFKDKLKTKKKHKKKKSKTKDNKNGEHIERKQKKKNSQGHKTNKKGNLESGLGIQNELIERREGHKEANTSAREKQDKSKEKDTKYDLKDLKILTSKLLSNFLQK